MNFTIVIEVLSADSNILIYSFDPTNAVKHQTSIRIMEAMSAANAPLPMQCLAEFYSVVTRKRFASPDVAAAIVDKFIETLHIITAEVPDLIEAMALQRQHGFQVFDAMIIATAIRAGCTVLISEDLQHGRTLGPLTILNPFRLSPTQLETVLFRSLPGAR